MDFLTKIIFYFRKPKIVIVVGRSRIPASEAIFQVLKTRFSVKKFSEKIPCFFDKERVFIIETGFGNPNFFKKIDTLIKLSQLPVLIVTNMSEISNNSFSTRAPEIKEIEKIVQLMPAYGSLILNFDDRTVRKIDELTNLKSFTFGFEEKADFRASDIHTTETGINPPPFYNKSNKRWGVNFKINYKGKIIPIWQEGSLPPTFYHEKVGGKEKIYSILAASCVGTILGLNLVEISEALKKDLQK